MLTFNNAGVIGGPGLSTGGGIPPPGGGGISPGDLGGFASNLATYLTVSAESGLPNSQVFAGPIIVNSTGVPPTQTTYLWLDASSSPAVLKYFDTTTSTWTPVATVSAGSATFFTGSSTPASGLGVDGDFYIQTVSPGNLYQKQSGAWVVLISLLGTTGATGATGPTGATGQGFILRGGWSVSVAYNAYDVVTYNGAVYAAPAGSTAVTPGTDPTKWTLWASTPYGILVTTVLGEVPSGTLDGVNVVFTLAHTPIAGVSLYRGGIRMQPGGSNDYTLAGATITFGTAPPVGINLIADYDYGGVLSSIVGETPSGTTNGSNTAFTLANLPSSGIALWQDGVRLTPGAGNDYTLAGTSLTMLAAPPTGAVLAADYMFTSALPIVVRNETPMGSIDGTNTAFTLIASPLYGVDLFQAGVGRLSPGADYTIVDKSITMVTAPPGSSWLLADYQHG